MENRDLEKLKKENEATEKSIRILSLKKEMLEILDKIPKEPTETAEIMVWCKSEEYSRLSELIDELSKELNIIVTPEDKGESLERVLKKIKDKMEKDGSIYTDEEIRQLITGEK